LLVLALLFLLGAPDVRASQDGDARAYPALFGTRETYSSDFGRFFKWTDMLQRWTEQRSSATTICTLGQTAPCEPREWRRLVDLLTPLELRAKVVAVNSLINRYPYIPSSANWREANHWETPFEFLVKSGQCQDYAITKFMLLRAAGVPNELLRVVVLRDTRISADHAVVVVYVDGQALMLDNQISEVAPVATITHYRPYYSINETGWWLHDPNPLQITSAILR